MLVRKPFERRPSFYGQFYSQQRDTIFKFDAYLHGTNSSILLLLDKTDMTLYSPIEMIEKYHLAPLCGEIRMGGWEKAQCTGAVAFGHLQSSKGYTLGTIIQDYAQSEYQFNEQLLIAALFRRI